MKTRKLAAFTAAALIASTGLIASQTASATDTPPAGLPLHNDTANSEPNDCPEDGAAYWHFVLTPNNDKSSFVSITLNLGLNDPHGVHTFSGDDIVPNGVQTDNVFVKVPAGHELDDLVKSGSSAIVTGPASKFVLSHTCPGGFQPEPPVVTIAKTAEVAHQFYYPWTVDKEKTSATVVFGDGWPYLLVGYNVTPTKGSEATPLSGSYVVTGEITVTFEGEDVELTSIVDELPGATCSLDSDPDLGTSPVNVDYTCLVPGLPTGNDLNVATVEYKVGEQTLTHAGTAPVDYDSSVGTEVDNPYTLVDDKYGALPNEGGAYSLKVYPTVENCDPGYTNTVTLDPLYGLNATDFVTVHVCNTTGGHTIGYWFASPTGSALTAGNFPSLKATYPNVLGSIPNLTSGQSKGKKIDPNSTAVFLQNASCAGNCWSMVQAQFIATAMSVHLHNTGGQCMLVPASIDPDGQMTIHEFLVWINVNVDGTNVAENQLVAELLDAINNDAALAC